MRIPVKTLAVAATLITGLATASALQAHESRGSMMGPGMMGHTGEMMKGCNKMMQSMHQDGSRRPNEQWREESPDHEDKPRAGS